MPPWKNEEEMFALASRELFTAVVGDIMDGLGLRHQFLSPRLRPLRDGVRIVGRAMTVLEADVFDPLGRRRQSAPDQAVWPDARGPR